VFRIEQRNALRAGAEAALPEADVVADSLAELAARDNAAP
jgi:hypothetical protein